MNDAVTLLGLYLGNVFIIALPLAILEIWLEKFKAGWDSEFKHHFWGRKIEIKILLRMTDKAYITVYHFVMFGLLLPMIFILESFFLFNILKNGFWITQFESTRFVPLIFFFAVWLGVTVVEDFFWFVLNWRYPEALGKLFKAELAWHTHWIGITKTIKVPRFYITGPIVVFILFIINYILIQVT